MLNTTLLDDVSNTFDLLRRSMDEFFGGFGASSETAPNGTFAPAFEAAWASDKLNIRVILPGISEKDVKVTVQGNQLLIEGERKAPENFSANGYSCLSYGKFFRAIDLPDRLDLEKVSCRLHDGVLDIEIPVKAEMKPREIPVGVAESGKALAA